MIKLPKKRTMRLRMRFQLYTTFLVLKPLLSNNLTFFLLLSNLGFLLQFAQLLTKPTYFIDTVSIFSFILVILAFLSSLILLCLLKKLLTLPQSITFPFVALFLWLHFYILLFAIDARLDFALLNSLIVWENALKTVQKIQSKAILLLPVAALLAWKLDLFDSSFPEIILFFTSSSLILIRKTLKTDNLQGPSQTQANIMISESTNSKIEQLDKSRAPKDQLQNLQVLASLKEAVLLFTPSLKLVYSNPYVSSLFTLGILFTQRQIENEILSIQQDEKSLHLKGLAFQGEAEFNHLIRAFKSKMALFTSSVTDLNDESNTSNLSKKTIKSMISGQKRMRQSRGDTYKSRVETYMERSRHKDPKDTSQRDVREIEKIKLKGLHFLNRNIKYSKFSQKTIKSLPEIKTIRDILRNFLELQWTDCNFFAKANDPTKILFVSLGLIDGGVLVMIKSLDRKDPLFSVWDVYEAQNKLLASMCHELRTPLNSITNMLELMDNIEDDNESLYPSRAHREYLSSAILNSKLLLSSINDFLDYFSVSADIFEVKTRDFNFQRLLLECESIFRSFSVRKMVNFFLQMPEMDTYFCCNDEDRIKQIIINLLNNAFKYTLAGGTIVLKLKARTEVFEVSVRDTGLGIEPQNYKSLGNFQSPSTNESPSLGGFGLTISNILANFIGPHEDNGKNYRGLKLRTEKDKGSRFSFLIDKTRKDFEDTDSVGESKALEGKMKNIEKIKKIQNMDCRFFAPEEDMSPMHITPEKCYCRKILAVDDNEFNLFVLSEQFKKQNMFIDISSGGVEAVNAVEEILIDPTVKFCPRCKFYKLILMDIDMPIKNGYEATQEILGMLKGTGIHVNIVALSAFSQANAREKAFEAGIVDYLEKPFSPAKMEYLIDKYV